MENHIEYINQYINEQLSETEQEAFNNQLKTDPAFNSLYQEQLVFLEGLKRTQLKAEITSAKSNYIKIKWLKNIGLPVIIIGVLALCYGLFFGTINKEEQLPSSTNVESINSTDLINEEAILINKTNDSLIKKYTVIYKKDTTVLDKEKTKIHLVNYYNEKTIIKFSGLLTLEEFQQKYPKSKDLKPVNDSIVIHIPVKEKKSTEDHAIVSKMKIEKPVEGNNAVVNKSVMSLFDSVKKKPEVFEIDANKDTIIIGKKGTKIQIEANSFKAKGKVKIEVAEFYELSDMLLANLSTKAGDEILETGGMLNIKAYDVDEEIALKQNKTIALAFPEKTEKEGMQLFSGDHHTEDNINWTLEGDLSDLVIGSRPIEWTEGEDYDPTLRLKEIMQDSTFEVSPELYELYKKYRKQKLIRDIGPSDDRKIIIRKPLLEIENSPFKVLPGDSISRGGHIIRRPSEFKQKRFRRPITDLLRRSGQDKYNVFEATKLGWINCDRFVKFNKTRVKYKLKIKGVKDADVKMVFKSVNSILPSKNYDDEYNFGRVPINENVILIAIKEVDGKLFLAIEEAETKPKPAIDFKFKEVTREELKSSLQKLNNGFN